MDACKEKERDHVCIVRCNLRSLKVLPAYRSYVSVQQRPPESP